METTGKPFVNKPLDVQGEEGASQNSFQKRNLFKVLTPEQEAKRETFKKALTWLCETFPRCFNLSAPKPLKRHIEAEIFLHLPEDGSISRKIIRTVLAFYVKRETYHKGLVENTHRFNLEGFAAEEIESAHKDHAKAILEEKKVKMKAMQQKNQEFPSGHTQEYTQKTKRKL
ncbi:MAG: ProQ/FinO family protein [Alphaproteobacteria bacterium]|nr:ProQ/FinO family protein [Alphaproteobacteria bacterium]